MRGPLGGASCALLACALSLPACAPGTRGPSPAADRASADGAGAASQDDDDAKADARGSVVLLKLRRDLRTPLPFAAGRRSIGLADFDAALEALDAVALAAFPLGPGPQGSPAHDRAGLGRWLILDVPSGVGPARLRALLASHPDVEPGTLSFEDSGFLRATPAALGAWLQPLSAPAVRHGPAPRSASRPRFARPPPERALPPELLQLGVQRAWALTTGDGVGIAVVDSGIDRNHLALSGQLRAKLGERPGVDADGNGVPGDVEGVNLAHLAIVREAGGAVLALATPADWSDWHGVQGDPRMWGRGTAIASLALGSGEAGSRPGVAPDAWLLPVDVQENLSAGPWQPSSDPRARPLPADRAGRAGLEPLRESAWARALGVVYALDEGARVIACAWPGGAHHPVIADALAHAEAQCAVSICASEGKSLAGDVASAPEPRDPEPRARVAVSNPRNDATPLPDRRLVLRSGSLVQVGLDAGVAALVLSVRPDLAAEDVHAVLADGAPLDAARSVRRARTLPTGRCADRAPSEPLWRRYLRALPDTEAGVAAPRARKGARQDAR